MSSAAGIRYLTRQQINTSKWNAAVAAAPNGLIYAHSWYLDALCDNWSALVLDDYSAVMPLPWRQKWGIRYVYTPPFIQQLGIVGSVDDQTAAIFIHHMQQRFVYGSYWFNFGNKVSGSSCTNFLINLSASYYDLKAKYAVDLLHNLKKAAKYKHVYVQSDSFTKAINLYQQHYQARLSGVSAEDFERFAQLCSRLLPNEQILMREVIDNNHTVLACALLLRAKNRLYLLMCITTDAGRRVSATHFLLDHLIQEFANTDTIFDFEGSDLPGVHHFYKNFGAQNQPYFFYHWNHLPIPLRWIKK